MIENQAFEPESAEAIGEKLRAALTSCGADVTAIFGDRSGAEFIAATPFSDLLELIDDNGFFIEDIFETTTEVTDMLQTLTDLCAAEPASPSISAEDRRKLYEALQPELGIFRQDLSPTA